MIVLDASALVDVVLDQPDAGWVLDQIAAQEVSAPAHQPAEVISVLARLERAGEIDAVAARNALDEAMALPQRLLPPTIVQLRRAYALRDRIRVLDGLYVAATDELGCALVTTDLRLARAAPPCEVRTPPHL